MKKITNLFLILVSAVTIFTSCNDDDHYSPPSDVETSFNSNFPNSTNVYWYGYGFYQLAEFNQSNGNLTTAYFNTNGLLLRTGINVEDSEIPETVNSAFLASPYGSWEVYDLGVLERINMHPLYVYTVGSGETTFMLYYNLLGNLMMQLNGGPVINSASTIPFEIVLAVNSAYPNSLIVDSRNLVDGTLEVEILLPESVAVVVFSNSLSWVCTYWEVPMSEVPTVVMDAFNTAASSMADGYAITQILYKELPDNVEYYSFCLMKTGMPNIYININPSGEVID